MLNVTTDEIEGKAPEITDSLDELARQGSRRMILAALELEVESMCKHCAMWLTNWITRRWYAMLSPS
jgi:hypothetical protein